MSNLGHGVHITPPQPIAEAIAWHTVPAQLSALRKMLRDAQTDRERILGVMASNFKTLFDVLTDRIEGLQQQLEESTDALGQRFDALEQAGQALACAQHDQLGELGAALANTFHQGLNSLDKAQQARLDDERKLTTQRLDAMHDEFEGVQVIQQVAAAVLSERIDRLEQTLWKRLWRWLTRPWRRNG